MSEEARARNGRAKKGLSVSTKIAGAAVAGTIVAIVSVGGASMWYARSMAVDAAEHEVATTATAQAAAVAHYLETVAQDLDVTASSGETHAALTALTGAYAEIAATTTPTTYLQDLYIENSPHPVGERHALDFAADGSRYSEAHGQFHPSLRNHLVTSGYYDIFLINADGDIVYTVYKELDFATNLVSGAYASSGLGQLFQRIAADPQPGAPRIVDFAAYAPSHGAPAAFIGQPMFDGEGRFIGVLAFQLPSDRIAYAMSLGTETISFLVGADGLLRSEVDAVEGDDILQTGFDVAQTFEGARYVRGAGLVYEDSLLAVAPMSFMDLNWSVVGEVSADQALTSVSRLLNALLIIAAIALCVIAPALLLVGVRLARPIRELQNAVERIASGAAIEIPGRARGDEIGALADAMTAINEEGRKAKRIYSALETTAMPLMIADQDYNIIFANTALKTLIKETSDYWESKIPNFQADHVVGMNMDVFHQTPQMQRGKPASMTANAKISLSFDGRDFDLAVSKIRDDRGEIAGTVVQWTDRTQEKRVEEQISSLLTDFRRGELGRRVSLEQPEGFVKDVSGGVNELCQTVEGFLDDIGALIGRMSRGDLTTRSDAFYEGRFATIQDGANATQERLRALIGEIQTATDDIAATSRTIHDGAVNLSSRAENQASALEETAATMEEMTANIKASAENAAAASDDARAANARAATGGAVVEETIEAIANIQTSSTRISEITKVIDGIAFQTNLLALNAAVEAARAGAAGKGFAVVASEVRALAERASEATRDIKVVIDSSAAQVDRGVELVNSAGAAFNEMIDAVAGVTRRIEDISRANQEQAAGVDEVTRTVSHMDGMTQENAALADTSASGSKVLKDRAESLQSLLRFFETDGSVERQASAVSENRAA